MSIKKKIIIALLLIVPYALAPYHARWLYPPKARVNIAYSATITTTNGGYTIFQREQVLPKYVLKSDATGTMEYLNPGPVPVYPSTFGTKLCYSTPFNLYSAANAERLEVWQDSIGTATVSEILAVCPQFQP